MFYLSINLYKSKWFNFSVKIYERWIKCQQTKLFIYKRFTILVLTIFSWELRLLFITEKCYSKNKKFIFPPKYMSYGKLKKKICSFQRDLQICWWPFSHKSYIVWFFNQKSLYKNKWFNFLVKIYERWVKCWETKLFIYKRFTTLGLTILSWELRLFIFYWKTLF